MNWVIRYARLLPLLMAALAGCATVDFDYPRQESYAHEDTSDTRLGRDITSLGEIPDGYGGFHLLRDSIDALSTRLLLAARAERTIDAQYYLVDDDTVGYLCLRALLAAADRGVRVRLLLDDFLTSGLGDGLLAMASHPNIEVRLYNPFARRGWRLGDFTLDFSRINRRMHNKLFIVDNQAAIIGGRNIADEYFGASVTANFGDLDALGVGPVVREASKSFDSYWNNRISVPIEGLTEAQPDLAALNERMSAALEGAETGPYSRALDDSIDDYRKAGIDLHSWAPYTFLYDPPVKPSQEEEEEIPSSILTPIIATADSATEELIVVSPYFVLNRGSIEQMGEAVRRGVRVRVITNSLASNNHALVHSGYAPTRKRLLSLGVEIYEVRPDSKVIGVAEDWADKATLHTKAFLVDRKWIFLGSFNWDPRSAYLNTESGLILEEPTLVDDLVRDVDQKIPTHTYTLKLDERNRIRWHTTEPDGTALVYTKEPETSAWLRFRVGLMSLLPIKGQL